MENQQCSSLRQAHSNARRREVAQGLRASLAAGLGLFPIGVALGMLVVQSGLPWWVAPLLSAVVFTGSLELLLVGMIASVTPLATIALTTLLVNFRHAFYAVSFPLRAVRSPLGKAYSMHALVDEAYAVTASDPGRWSGRSLLALQIAVHSYWIGGGLAGVAVAQLMPHPVQGLEFALCALFITLTLDSCRTRGDVPSLLLGGLSFTGALVLVPEHGLLLGMVGLLGGLVVRHLVRRSLGRGSAARASREREALHA
ncbi:AzlC family ABC transporter permease [Nesterenkonia xinjiangensis]|uniref:4-azaleucine resistance transporter AzlC n=1 Tax=Nesterenkonia xinjiangensis TaxID=225327 RepID=A0A7Z0GLT7_9MICC|nr:AzlC family ABC transporter permease [Nesterenkonia xinjiangensis]NYJ78371.1 4-azaleucine resistance transporter AzlC [Nesterenkonia xinjiangensis]